MKLVEAFFVVCVITLPQCLYSFYFVPIQMNVHTTPTTPTTSLSSSSSLLSMSTVPSSTETKKPMPIQRSYWSVRNAVNYKLPDKRRLTDKEEIFAGKLSRIAFELEKKKKAFEKTHERDMTPKQWAEAANLSIEELKQTIRLSQLAREKLIAHNLRLIDYVVCELLDKRPNYFAANSFQMYSGLFQQGVIGLKKAAEYYDGRYKFSFFAIHFIRNELHRYLTSESVTSHVPHKVMLTGIRINNMKKRLTTELQRPPTDEELSKKLSFSIHRINKVLQFIKLKSNVKSLQAPIASSHVNNGGDKSYDMFTYSDSLVRSTPINPHIGEKIVRDYLLTSGLSKEEIEVILWRFGLSGDRNSVKGKLSTLPLKVKMNQVQLHNYIEKVLNKLNSLNPLREGDELIDQLSSKIGFVTSMSQAMLA